MKVLIVGSGLIGVTTAYLLAGRGHEVTVLDRQAGPARETSFANGALLVPSMPEPWNSPGCWRVLLRSLVRSDTPLQFRLSAMPSLLAWGLAFLRNSSRECYERNTLINLRLALYSRDVLTKLSSETPLDYGHGTRGTLRVFRSSAALKQAMEGSRQLMDEGLRLRELASAHQLATLEPALKPIAGELAGAIHYEDDETGDAYRFCVALTELARQRGVQFRFGTTVDALTHHAGEITGAICGERRCVADRYIIAAGSYSTPLLKPCGINLPVRPAKGYSVTLAHAQSPASLRIPVIDDALHAVVVPLEGAIRVAGTAEFAGYDLTLRPERIQNLLVLLGKVLPEMRFTAAAKQRWCGLRAVSADGVPIIGPTKLHNLFVSTGHGHLGWTMAAGSAQLMTDLIEDKPSSIDARPYALARFSSSR